jgi:hypothetical protein
LLYPLSLIVRMNPEDQHAAFDGRFQANQSKASQTPVDLIQEEVFLHVKVGLAKVLLNGLLAGGGRVAFILEQPAF